MANKALAVSEPRHVTQAWRPRPMSQREGMFFANEGALLSGRPWPDPCPHTSLSPSASKAWTGRAQPCRAGMARMPSASGLLPAQPSFGGGGREENKEASGLSLLLCCCCYLRPNSRDPHQGRGAPTCPTGPAGCPPPPAHLLLPALLWESPRQGLHPAPERGCDPAFERGLSSESSPLACN